MCIYIYHSSNPLIHSSLMKFVAEICQDLPGSSFGSHPTEGHPRWKPSLPLASELFEEDLRSSQLANIQYRNSTQNESLGFLFR